MLNEECRVNPNQSSFSLQPSGGRKLRCRARESEEDAPRGHHARSGSYLTTNELAYDPSDHSTILDATRPGITDPAVDRRQNGHRRDSDIGNWVSIPASTMQLFDECRESLITPQFLLSTSLS
ncbi:hypothetical protein EDB19DRAFT_1831198 [Suillus lakei]|nr:hypothetical protein EDB19DRAFT_1831198 [Suillus lakei]